RYAYTRTLTSGRITTTLHDVDEAGGIVEIDTGLEALALEGRQRVPRPTVTATVPRQRLSESVLDHGGERSAGPGRERLGLAQKGIVEPHCRAHASKNI